MLCAVTSRISKQGRNPADDKEEGRVFVLEAQVLGNPHTTRADRDDSGTIVVITSSGPHRARSVNDAVRIARQDMGEFLLPAQRPGRPWGLRLEVAGVQAVYGEWPLFPGRSDGRRDNSLVTRIRSRWNDGRGPLSALENACEIIKAYLGSSGRAAA